ncbi:MAG: response regulator [Candidatus Micrarchaeia archaeon]
MQEELPVMLEARVLRALEAAAGASEEELTGVLGVEAEAVRAALARLRQAGAVEARRVGGATAWYALALGAPRRVLIVEDDANINNLMRLTLGQGFEIRQAYSAREAFAALAEFKPDLVVLDLMLPDADGLEICRRIKENPQTRNVVVIIVSAADAAKNRLAGMRLGADYYIRKPFSPDELRALARIFLKKQGSRFDPLTDLPDERRITAALERGLREDFEFHNLRIENLDEHARNFGKGEAEAIVRLVSQILQDKVSEWDSKNGFVGYLGNGEFVAGGRKNEVQLIISEVSNEFERVLPFIYQGKAAQLELGIEDVFEAGRAVEKPLRLAFTLLPTTNILRKREGILEGKALPAGGVIEVGAYTYEELRALLGSENVDVAITRDERGVRLHIGK